MSMQWYALHSKPRKEEAVWQQVVSHGFETFYPQIVVQPANPRARKVRPYFPGYLFVYADLDRVGVSIFSHMPFANGLVSFGGVPAEVPADLLAAIERHVEQINAVGGEILYHIQPGDVVEIRSGPFVDCEAIFDTRLSGSDRVRVLLRMLNDRHVPVELHVGQIRRR